MTTYGTISEAAEEPSNKPFVSRATERFQKDIGTTRPWKEMIQPNHLRFPLSFFDSIHRIKTNAEVFRANYVIIILVILFLSLLWHPISLITLLVMMVAWLSLYFLRDEPLITFRYEIDDRLVAASLLLITCGLLFLTNVAYNIIVGISVALAVVLVHAVIRETEHPFDEEAGIIATTGGNVVKVPLKQADSSSFTLP